MMQKTGFHTWGFVFVRATSYGGEHDKRWESFITTAGADAENLMTRKPVGRPKDEATPALLLPLLKWDTLEDPDRLERASIEDAKTVFLEWRMGTCAARDGEGADHLFVRMGRPARFRYFVMVDDESLDSMPDVELDAPDRRMRLGRLPPMKVRVVDAGPVEDDEKARLCARAGWEYHSMTRNEGGDSEDEDDEESEDGDDDEEYGWGEEWMWVETSFLLGFYDIAQAESGWDCFYERPPKVYPR